MKLLRKILLRVVLLVIVVATFVVALGYVDYQNQINAHPIKDALATITNKEHYTDINQISKTMQDAMVAIEDRRFYSHSGIDAYAIARSVFVNVTNQGNQGGSTLTQQLAKNLYFMDNNNGIRKLSEAFIAQDMESKYTKQEILALYLNVVYFGDGFYGIYEASMGYFNVLPSELSLAQASMLAGLPQAPSVYMLSNNASISVDRQKQVLNSMLELQMITKVQYDQAQVEELKVVK